MSSHSLIATSNFVVNYYIYDQTQKFNLDMKNAKFYRQILGDIVSTDDSVLKSQPITILRPCTSKFSYYVSPRSTKIEVVLGEIKTSISYAVRSLH